MFFKKSSKRKPSFTFSNNFMENEYFANNIKICLETNTNLVVASYYCACDEEVAKYRGRVFCIDGTDKRFPPLSDDVLKCNLSFDPFYFGLSLFEVKGKEIDPIRYSNRPFVDDRTTKEKADYNKIIIEDAAAKKLREEFKWIQKELPDIAPKSLSAYSRMKNSSSSGYKKIYESAASKGYFLGK